MVRIYCLLIGYLLGLFQTAYIYGRLHGIDIRQYGSGNAGTTNTLRVLGKKAGIVVLLGDILKCILAVAIVRILFAGANPEMNYLYAMYAAAGAILGHNYPFYLKFKGGKGIAATAGLIISFHWIFFVIIAPIFFIVFFVTHYVSLGSLVVYASFLLELIIVGQSGFFGMTQAHLNEMYLVALFLTGMAYYKHKDNIKRLIRGEERKTFLVKKSQK